MHLTDKIENISPKKIYKIIFIYVIMKTGGNIMDDIIIIAIAVIYYFGFGKLYKTFGGK